MEALEATVIHLVVGEEHWARHKRSQPRGCHDQNRLGKTHWWQHQEVIGESKSRDTARSGSWLFWKSLKPRGGDIAAEARAMETEKGNV